jgi:hypothetical protein
MALWRELLTSHIVGRAPLSMISSEVDLRFIDGAQRHGLFETVARRRFYPIFMTAEVEVNASGS